MLNNQIEGKINEYGDSHTNFEDNHIWDDHTVMIWDYERAYVIYFPSEK